MPAELSLRDLGFLRAPLPTPTTDLESVDPILATFSALADKGQYAELAAEIEKTFDGGIYDIRPISYYLWLVFQSRQIEALGEIFVTIEALLTFNYAAVGPRRKRDEHTAKRLVWLFQIIGDSLHYHTSRRSDDWSRWRAAGSGASLDEALQRAQGLGASLSGTLNQANNALQQLVARMRALFGSLSSGTIEPPPKTSPAGAMAPSLRPGGRAPSIAAPTGPTIREVAQLSDEGLGRIELGASHSFFELVQKLDAFSRLMKKGDYARAAIVSHDVLETLESFDPRQYFPELFSEFSELVSKHVAQLAQHWEEKETVSWKARTQFYRVDLRRFADG